MGGYLALVAAAGVGARGRRGDLPGAGRGAAPRAARTGASPSAPTADGARRAARRDHDETDAAAALDVPLLLLHAEGDESVPVEQSRALHAAAPAPPRGRPGGHHRSIQHDPELQAVAVRFLARRCAERAAAAAPSSPGPIMGGGPR